MRVIVVMGIACRAPKPRVWVLLVLFGLAFLAYWRALSLPFIADDYVQIRLAREYGPPSGWPGLLADALYRCRATSLLLTYWTERWFGLHAVAFNWSSLILHVLNTWLVFALGVWKVIGWRISAPAAGFFAIYQGHQEAVIWYAALPELLVFFFALVCLLFWLGWLQESAKSFLWYLAALTSFLLALLSKESAVAIIPLQILVLFVERSPWRRWLALLPFFTAAVIYIWFIFAHQAGHLHFQDGTFSISAPLLITWARSFGRLLWIWGLISLAALLIWRQWRWPSLSAVAVAWIGITLLPYCFLTYMPRIPSRHTYFASAGLALIVGAGFIRFSERCHRRVWLPWAVATIIVLHDCGYLWIKKQSQFLERAAPTEALVSFAGAADSPVYLHCFPYRMWVAQWAVELRTHNKLYQLTGGSNTTNVTKRVFCSGAH